MIKGDRGSLWWGDIVFAWNRLWVCACAAVQCCHIYEIILFGLVLNVEKSIKKFEKFKGAYSFAVSCSGKKQLPIPQNFPSTIVHITEQKQN